MLQVFGSCCFLAKDQFTLCFFPVHFVAQCSRNEQEYLQDKEAPVNPENTSLGETQINSLLYDVDKSSCLLNFSVKNLYNSKQMVYNSLWVIP